MPEMEPSTHGEARLHWATLCVPALSSLAGMAIPLVFILFTGIGAALIVPIIAVTFLLSLGQAIRYFTVRYELKTDELVIRDGILEKKERQIPFNRIQNVRIEQKLPHRMFGVADVHIETAGSSGPEAALTVVGLMEARQLRDVVVHGTNGHVAPGTQESRGPTTTELRTVQPRELVLAGLSSQIVATIAALLGLLPYLSPKFAFIEEWFFQPFDEVDEQVSEHFKFEPDSVLGFLLNEHIAKTLLFIVGGLLISVAGYLLLWFGFQLSTAGDMLTWRHGLLTKRTGGAPRKRVQVLKIEEPLLRRLFKLATLKIDTAGDQLVKEEDKSGRGVLIPIIPSAETFDIARHVFPAIRFESRQWQKVSPLAVRRGTLKGSLFLLLFLLMIVPNAGWQALWALVPGVPLLWFLNYKAYHNTGYSFDAHVFAFRKGWLNRSTRFLPLRHIHLAAVFQTPFDRRLGLATLFIDTAGQTHTGGMPFVKHLPLAEARALAEVLLHPPRGHRRD